MENMSDIVRNMKNTNNEESDAKLTETLHNATGLNINATDMFKDASQNFSDENTMPDEVKPTPTAADTREVTDGMVFLNPEESKNYTGVKVDPLEDSIKEMDEKTTLVRKGASDEFNDILASALHDEETRLVEHEEKLNDTEYVEAIRPNDGKVQYQVTEEDATKKSSSSIVPPVDDVINDDYDDLIPSYTDDDDMRADKAPADIEDAPDPENEDAFRDYIQALDHVEIPSEDKSIVNVVKSATVELVSSKRNKDNKMLADQAFLNSITKFKKDNFKTVSVPLVNSGFYADIVGTGVVDLAQLYDDVNDNTKNIDYEIAKMKTVIKNVVGTGHKVSQMDLRNMIHFQDYQLMAFGHVCATLKEVEILANCEECGKPFRITATTSDLLLNMDELRDKADQIAKSPTISQCSLMANDIKLTSSKGFDIVLGHPSYAELIKKMNELKAYSSKMTEFESKKFLQMTDLLFMVKRVVLPNSVVTSNTYQTYMALTLISDDDMYAVEHEYAKMMKQVLIPKFGVKKVTCPHCHKVNTNITYNSLDELVFYHTQVSTLLKSPEN